MSFKCALCGLSFETPDDFVKHKLAHQQQSERPGKQGLTCLRCGRPIPTESYEPNYKGVIACPGCRQTMKVVMVNGEIEIAMSQGGTEQTGEELLKQYRKWVLEYNKVRDLIDSMVPVPAALFLRVWFVAQFGLGGTNVAWEAHAGGFVFGFAVTLFYRRRALRRVRAGW